MNEESFETKVLVSLAEIKGEIALARQQGNESSKRLDEHWHELKNLKALVYKGLGACLALVVAAPIVINSLGG